MLSSCLSIPSKSVACKHTQWEGNSYLRHVLTCSFLEPGQAEQALGGSKPGQLVQGTGDTKREFARLLEINVRVRSDGPEMGVSRVKNSRLLGQLFFPPAVAVSKKS